MNVVEKVRQAPLVVEREHRWMLHYIHAEVPLSNYQAVYYLRFVQAIRETYIDYLTESLKSILSAYLNDIAERKDSRRGTTGRVPSVIGSDSIAE